MKVFIMFDNPVISIPEKWSFTGRIKYTHGIRVNLYFEVEFEEPSRRGIVTTGYLWWKQTHNPEATFTRYKRWINEEYLYISDTQNAMNKYELNDMLQEVDEDYIHECTSKSTTHGESCCEDYW